MRERHGINPALHENVGKPTSELTATFGTGIEPVPTTGCTRRSSNRMASAAKLAVPCAGWRSATFSAEASPAMLPRAISSPCVLTTRAIHAYCQEPVNSGVYSPPSRGTPGGPFAVTRATRLPLKKTYSWMRKQRIGFARKTRRDAGT